jgi:hypothetical protein
MAPSTTGEGGGWGRERHKRNGDLSLQRADLRGTLDADDNAGRGGGGGVVQRHGRRHAGRELAG